ncbi:SAM-dependent methyltransferase [Rhodovibrio sodomensis]|uniref:SAM-dependent methyltransferase n=1 Tax=Rhodovibrio sodomensis TaxID=1088 RepID=A0ABS1D9X4_9PROT|nr:class I SAM-dependent methyltransferase [Rhodovibrio sodomensis]MBK1667212.1 SAM-dependent methyltransferase [Rhodovibrio sodomensis]
MPQFDDAASFWDSRYAEESYLFGTAPNAFLAREGWRLSPGWHALAVADGEGRNGVWMAEQGLRVTSIDISPRGTEKARALAAERGVTLDIRRVDVTTFDMGEGAYDAVVAIFIQFAPPGTREELFARMVRALKPGGLLFLQGYRPEQVDYGTGGPPHREHMYTLDMLETQFGSLEWLHSASYDAPLREGDGHDGLSALIELVARKPG